MRKKGKGNYAEDSTKGKALINPKTYKRDAYVQFWCDSRILAMLSNWLDKEDYPTRFMSEVLYRSLEIMVDNLIDNGMVDKIEFCQEARELLVRKYRINLNPNDKGMKNVSHNLHLDERRRDSSIQQSDQRPIISGSDGISAEVLASALAIYKKLEERDSGLVVDKEEIRERLKNSNSTKIVSNNHDSDDVNYPDEALDYPGDSTQSTQSHQIRKLTDEELDEVERRITEKDRLLAEKTKTIPLNIKKI